MLKTKQQSSTMVHLDSTTVTIVITIIMVTKQLDIETNYRAWTNSTLTDLTNDVHDSCISYYTLKQEITALNKLLWP